MFKRIMIFLFISTIFGQVSVDPDTINASTEMGTSTYQSLVFSNTLAGDVTYTVSVLDQTRSNASNLFKRQYYSPDQFEGNVSDNLVQDITFLNSYGQEIPGIRCATPQPSLAEDMIVQENIENWMATHSMHRDARDQVNILVAFHVIYSTTGQGDVPDSQIEEQIQVLNDAYAEFGIEFTLDIITRTENNAWFNDMDSYENTYKSQLAVDPIHYFNIYTGQPAGGILGWAWLPSSWPENSFMHGVVLLYSTLPGGTSVPYDEGDTATHETGHYLGLRHTFLNACSAPGDYIDDTPYQDDGNNIFTCNNGLDTCPQDGTDPVHNYMNYTDDPCLTEFTVLQGERIWAQINTYRPGLLENPVGIQWVSLPSDTLTLGGQGLDTVLVTLDASTMESGQYTADIILSDVDAVEPDLVIPVFFEVTATPLITVAEDTFSLGLEYVGYSEDITINVSNQGAAALILSGFTVSDSSLNYTGSPNVTVDPYGLEALQLDFLSNSVGEYEGTFSFSTNDPGHDTVVIQLFATVLNPPEIHVNTDTLYFTSEHDSSQLILENIGLSELDFSYHVNVDITVNENAVTQNFTLCEFPLDWMQQSSSGNGWQIGDQGASDGFPIPAGNGCYAYVNDDAQNVNGMSEILSTQILDLSNATSLFLFFNSYFTGENGQSASVVASLDGGISWETVMETQNYATWHTSFIDLNAYAGEEQCMIGFYTSDNGGHGTGWAIDNIIVNGSFMQPWLTAFPDFGTIQPGASDTLTLVAHPGDLVEGYYAGEFLVQSNDPANPTILVPLGFTVFTLSSMNNDQIPNGFSLYQNYPNPFNPSTAIGYDLPSNGDVLLTIFDITGRFVLSAEQNQATSGYHEWQWNGNDYLGKQVSAGMYFYKIEVMVANKLLFLETKKMVLLK